MDSNKKITLFVKFNSEPGRYWVSWFLDYDETSGHSKIYNDPRKALNLWLSFTMGGNRLVMGLYQRYGARLHIERTIPVVGSIGGGE